MQNELQLHSHTKCKQQRFSIFFGLIICRSLYKDMNFNNWSMLNARIYRAFTHVLTSSIQSTVLNRNGIYAFVQHHHIIIVDSRFIVMGTLQTNSSGKVVGYHVSRLCKYRTETTGEA